MYDFERTVSSYEFFCLIFLDFSTLQLCFLSKICVFENGRLKSVARFEPDPVRTC